MIYDPLLNFRTFQFSNGFRLHHCYRPESRVFAMTFVIHTGAATDPVQRGGLAHFVEHAAWPNASVTPHAMRETIGSFGGEVDFGKTGWFGTEYSFVLPNDRKFIAPIFGIAADMLFVRPIEVHVEDERALIKQEIGTFFPTERSFTSCLERNNALHGNQSFLSRMVRPFGTTAAVGATSIQDLNRLKERAYCPQNTTLVAVGDIPADFLCACIRQNACAIRVSDGIERKMIESSSTVPFRKSAELVIPFADIFNPQLGIRSASFETSVLLPGTYSRAMVNALCYLLHEALVVSFKDKFQWVYEVNVSSQHVGRFWEVKVWMPGLQLAAVYAVQSRFSEVVASISGMGNELNLYIHQEVEKFRRREWTTRDIAKEVVRDVVFANSVSSVTARVDELNGLHIGHISQALPFFERRFTIRIVP